MWLLYCNFIKIKFRISKSEVPSFWNYKKKMIIEILLNHFKRNIARIWYLTYHSVDWLNNVRIKYRLNTWWRPLVVRLGTTIFGRESCIHGSLCNVSVHERNDQAIVIQHLVHIHFKYHIMLIVKSIKLHQSLRQPNLVSNNWTDRRSWTRLGSHLLALRWWPWVSVLRCNFSPFLRNFVHYELNNELYSYISWAFLLHFLLFETNSTNVDVADLRDVAKEVS